MLEYYAIDRPGEQVPVPLLCSNRECMKVGLLSGWNCGEPCLDQGLRGQSQPDLLVNEL